MITRPSAENPKTFAKAYSFTYVKLPHLQTGANRRNFSCPPAMGPWSLRNEIAQPVNDVPKSIDTTVFLSFQPDAKFSKPVNKKKDYIFGLLVKLKKNLPHRPLQ